MRSIVLFACLAIGLSSKAQTDSITIHTNYGEELRINRQFLFKGTLFQDARYGDYRISGFEVERLLQEVPVAHALYLNGKTKTTIATIGMVGSILTAGLIASQKDFINYTQSPAE